MLFARFLGEKDLEPRFGDRTLGICPHLVSV